MRHDHRSTPPGLVLGGVCCVIRFRCLRCLRAATRRGRVCGDRAVRGRLRCPGAATRPGWVVWRSFGMREAVVPEGGGRAWPGFEPTRRAEGSRRGRRAGGLPPLGTESSRGGGLPPLGTESSRGGGLPPLGTESSRGGGLPPLGTESSRGGGLPPLGTDSSRGGGPPPSGTGRRGGVATGVPRGPS